MFRCLFPPPVLPPPNGTHWGQCSWNKEGEQNGNRYLILTAHHLRWTCWRFLNFCPGWRLLSFGWMGWSELLRAGQGRETMCSGWSKCCFHLQPEIERICMGICMSTQCKNNMKHLIEKRTSGNQNQKQHKHLVKKVIVQKYKSF